MSKGRGLLVLRPSLLDRLSSGEGENRDFDVGIDARELREGVRRDLERLLNTRRYLGGVLEGLGEAESSVLNYGLPDLTSFSVTDLGDRRVLCEVMRTTIQRFEPRLRPDTVAVTPTDSGGDKGLGVSVGGLHFVIDGVIEVEPYRERIKFDTSMHPEERTVAIEDVTDA